MEEIRYKGKYIPLEKIEKILSTGGEIIKNETGAGATYNLLLSKKKIIVILPTVNLIKEKEEEYLLLSENNGIFIYGGSKHKVSNVSNQRIIVLTPEQFRRLDIDKLVKDGYKLVIDEIHLFQKMFYRHSVSDIIEKIERFNKAGSIVTITATPYKHKLKQITPSQTYWLKRTDNDNKYNIKKTNSRLVFEELLKDYIDNGENVLLFSNSYSFLTNFFHFLMIENKNIDFWLGEGLRDKLKDSYYKFNKSKTSNIKVGSTSSAQGINILFNNMNKPTIFIHTTPNIDSTFFDVQDIRQIIGRTRSDVDIVLFVDNKPPIRGRKIKDDYNKELLELYEKNNSESRKELEVPGIMLEKFNCLITNINYDTTNKVGFSKPNKRHQFEYFKSHFDSTNHKYFYDLIGKSEKEIEEKMHQYEFSSTEDFLRKKRQLLISKKKGETLIPYDVDITKVEKYLLGSVFNNIFDDLSGTYSYENVFRLIYFYIILKNGDMYDILTHPKPIIYLYTILLPFFKTKSNDYLSIETSLMFVEGKRHFKKTKYFSEIILVFQKLSNVYTLKNKEVALYFNAEYFEWRNSHKSEKDRIDLSGIKTEKELHKLLICSEKTLVKKVKEHKGLSLKDIKKVRYELSSTTYNLKSLLAMALKDFQTIRIKRIDYRDYSPVTSLSIDLIKKYIPYHFIEIDMSQAYPTFVNMILGKNYTNIYEVLMNKLKITRDEAKTQYNTAVNMWERNHQSYKRFILSQIYESEDLEKLMEFNTKSSLFLELSKLEKEEYKRLRDFFTNRYSEDILLVRRHDSIIIFSNNVEDIYQYSLDMDDFQTKMKYKKNISIHRQRIGVNDKVLYDTVFSKIIKRDERNDYVIKHKNKLKTTIKTKTYIKNKGVCRLVYVYSISKTMVRKNKRVRKILSNLDLSMDYFLELLTKKTYRSKELWKM